MTRFDCHTHWGRAWTERDGEDPSRWLALAAQYGISRSLVLPEHGLFNAGAIPAEHDRLARICARSAGAMLPCCTACLAEPREALAEVRRCLAVLRFHGVKFHPWLQGCSVSDPAMDEIAELAAEFNVPLIFHDGTPPFSLPSQMAMLAQRHPRTTIILGHAVLFEHYREAAAAMRSAENLWACLCGPHLEGLRYLIAHCPIERLLWGTDAGYGLVDVYRYRVPLLDRLGLARGPLRRICRENPERLFRAGAQGRQDRRSGKRQGLPGRPQMVQGECRLPAGES